LIKTLRTKKNINPYINKIKEFEGIVLSASDIARSGREFKFKLPVSIDVGCGNGEYLVDLASKNPERSYLGFELQYKEIYRTALKIKKLGLDNCKVVNMDAKDIPSLFKKDEIADVVILFPDPWPKRKQKKHRLIDKAYIKDLLSCMIRGGLIQLRTDNDDYFVQMLDVFHSLADEKKVGILELSRDFHVSEDAEREYITPFERIFLRQGLMINYMLVRSL